MTEWQAIAWVIGGIIIAINLFFLLKKLLDSYTAKIKSQNTEENRMAAYWDITDTNKDDIKEIYKLLKDQAEKDIANKELIDRVIDSIQSINEQRILRMPREIIKSDGVKELLKIHAEENEICKKLYEQLEKMDEAERNERRAIPPLAELS